MAHAAYLREKARQMRVERRMSIDELAERLALSRSTIYYWVRDLPIPGSGPGGGFSPAAHRRGSLAMQARFRKLRDEAYAQGEVEFDELARDASFRDFVCLYVAEGYKRNRNVVSICNSDIAVMKLSLRWIRRFAANKICFAIQYHADQDLDALRITWAEELDIHPQSIRMQRKSNSSGLAKTTWRCRNGVLTVTVGDTVFRARLQAWIDCLRRSWD